MEKGKKMDLLIHKFRGAGLLSLCLLLFVTGVYYLEGGEQKESIPASAQVKNRKLPIYCVDTDQPKVALSFDAAWAGEKMRCDRVFLCKKENIFA